MEYMAQLAGRVGVGAGTQEQFGKHVGNTVRREHDVVAPARLVQQVPIQVQCKLEMCPGQPLQIASHRRLCLHDSANQQSSCNQFPHPRPCRKYRYTSHKLLKIYRGAIGKSTHVHSCEFTEN